MQLGELKIALAIYTPERKFGGTWPLGVIFRECLDSSTVTSSPFTGKETKRSVTGSFEFTVTMTISILNS